MSFDGVNHHYDWQIWLVLADLLRLALSEHLNDLVKYPEIRHNKSKSLTGFFVVGKIR